MGNLTSVINVNIDAKDKEEATRILKSLGLNMSTAINMFIKKVIEYDGIPFSVVNHKPSNELIQALKEAEDISSGKIKSKKYHDIDEMFRDLDEED